MRPALLAPLLLAACAPALPPPGPGPGPGPSAGVETPLRLVGTEPFWGGRIDGRTVELSGVDRPTVTARIVGVRPSLGGAAYAAEAGAGASFTAIAVALDRRPCSDGMSDRTYPYEASVFIGTDPNRPTETLRGCAIPERLWPRPGG